MDNPWSRSQHQIDREMCSIKILEIIKAFPPDTLWTNKTLSKVARLNLDTVRLITRGLVLLEYITTWRGIYRITDKGNEYYDGAKSKPWFGTFTEWRNEALQGISNRGKRSSIKNAVLPKGKGHVSTPLTPEDIYSKYESDMRLKQRVAYELKISMREYDQRIKDGSIRLCKGIDLDYNGQRINHLGIFDRHGKGWQYLCKQCRKRLRKKKRKLWKEAHNENC